MSDYRVRFCNDLQNSTGHSFHTCQREIMIRFADSQEAAVETAKSEFERLEQIASWRLHATTIECDEIQLAAEAGEDDRSAPNQRG